jgi:saccharopine dehydrogenase-like NADP-dependent oxidoreductase
MSRARARATVAVLGGAGLMGRATVWELARLGHPVRLVDTDRSAARAIARRYGGTRTAVEVVESAQPDALAAALRGAAVVVNCAPYGLNLAAMEAALRAECHYLDLGGLFHTTRRQLRLDRKFRDASLLALLGMGSAPGVSNVLARAGADPLPRVHAIRVYNGGADFTRYQAPLAFGFSPATVLDELTLPPMVFTNGRFRAAPPRSGAEEVDFDLGFQKVHLSLHSEVATLPLTYREKGIRECFFKIAYDPVLVERLTLLADLGLADRDRGPRGVAPRDVLLDCFRRLPPPPAFVDDRDTLAVVVEGEDRRGRVIVRHDVTALPQRRPPLSAVARHTGLPPAIVTGMILDGTIRVRGVRPPERSVPVRPFLAALEARGMPVRRTVTRPVSSRSRAAG